MASLIQARMLRSFCMHYIAVVGAKRLSRLVESSQLCMYLQRPKSSGHILLKFAAGVQVVGFPHHASQLENAWRKSALRTKACNGVNFLHCHAHTRAHLGNPDGYPYTPKPNTKILSLQNKHSYTHLFTFTKPQYCSRV